MAAPRQSAEVAPVNGSAAGIEDDQFEGGIRIGPEPDADVRRCRIGIDREIRLPGRMPRYCRSSKPSTSTGMVASQKYRILCLQVGQIAVISTAQANDHKALGNE